MSQCRPIRCESCWRKPPRITPTTMLLLVRVVSRAYRRPTKSNSHAVPGDGGFAVTFKDFLECCLGLGQRICKNGVGMRAIVRYWLDWKEGGSLIFSVAHSLSLNIPISHSVDGADDQFSILNTTALEFFSRKRLGWSDLLISYSSTAPGESVSIVGPNGYPFMATYFSGTMPRIDAALLDSWRLNMLFCSCVCWNSCKSFESSLQVRRISYEIYEYSDCTELSGGGMCWWRA